VEQLLDKTWNKFRGSSLQGQFSELPLCNLLQHYFRAAPLPRNMPITTSRQWNVVAQTRSMLLGIKGNFYTLEKLKPRTAYSIATCGVGRHHKDVVEKHYPINEAN